MAYQHNNNGTQSTSDKAIGKFAEMMISRLEQAQESEWKKGWIGGSGFIGMPQNLNGRNYSGTNSLFLLMDTAQHGYAAPVYMTFLQKEKEGLRINKGSQAMPVVYWDMSVKDADGKKVSVSDYKNMSKEEQKKCEVRPFLRSFRVYNIDQTNMKEVNKEKYDSIVARFQPPKLSDAQGMYQNTALDRMFDRQEWVCKIQHDRPADQPFYSPSNDLIVIPQKEQFKIGKTDEERYKDGMEYYSTALHEMAHSTGAESRLNRNIQNHFGDPKYAKEELVAELTAAMVGNTMGFDRRIQDNNVAYIDGWLHALREEPRFIVSVMADVNKASNMILEKVDEQKLALGESSVLANKDAQEQVPNKQQETTQVKVNPDRNPLGPADDYNDFSQALAEGIGVEPRQKQQGNHVQSSMSAIKTPAQEEQLGVTAGIYKLPTGSYVVRASVGDRDLEQKPIDNKTAVAYLRMDDATKMGAMLAGIVKDKYGDELRMPREVQQVTRGLKI